MGFYLRISAMLVSTLALVVAALFLCTPLTGEKGLPISTLAQLREQFAQEDRRETQIICWRGELEERIRIQEYVVQLLIADRLQLADAIAQIEAAWGKDRLILAADGLGLPGRHAKEKIGRLLIEWACGEVRTFPQESSQLRRRLEQDLIRLSSA